jgi:hypothetical protein
MLGRYQASKRRFINKWNGHSSEVGELREKSECEGPTDNIADGRLAGFGKYYKYYYKPV